MKVDQLVDAALSGIVKGTVAGEGGPLVGVVVSMTVNGIDFVELTDETGAFTIKQALPVGRY